MPAPKGNKFAQGNPGGGRKSLYDEKYIKIARAMAALGATDIELADAFGVDVRTLNVWKNEHEEFSSALKVGKAPADDRVKRSLYQRAVGYSYDAVKIFMPGGTLEPVYAPYVEHVPPDVNACHIWLRNRCKDEFRDKQEVEHSGSVTLESLILESLKPVEKKD